MPPEESSPGVGAQVNTEMLFENISDIENPENFWRLAFWLNANPCATLETRKKKTS